MGYAARHLHGRSLLSLGYVGERLGPVAAGVLEGQVSVLPAGISMWVSRRVRLPRSRGVSGGIGFLFHIAERLTSQLRVADLHKRE